MCVLWCVCVCVCVCVPVPVLQVCVETGEREGKEAELLVMKPRSFYSSEAQWLGCHGIVMAAGLRGAMWEGWGGETLVSWPLAVYSGWTVLALETARVLQTPRLGLN